TNSLAAAAFGLDGLVTRYSGTNSGYAPLATVLALGAVPSMRSILILELPATLDSVVTPKPRGSSMIDCSICVTFTYKRGAATGWLPRPNSSLRRLYSTPSLGLATANT